MPLYTPLSGSWLTMAESGQRILVGRALAGQQPQAPGELIAWRDDTVAGWPATPTPLVWPGTRDQPRHRARQRRLASAPVAQTASQVIAA